MLAKLTSILMVSLMSQTVMSAGTCNLWQTCKNNEGKMPGDTLDPCLSGNDVARPIFIDGNFEATPLTETGRTAFEEACPGMNSTMPMCCSDDNAEIMSK